MSETTTIQESAAEKPGEPHGHRSEDTTLSEYLESLLVTVLLALFATTFVLQAFKIPSPSMESTLLVGDHLLVNTIRSSKSSAPTTLARSVSKRRGHSGDRCPRRIEYMPSKLSLRSRRAKTGESKTGSSSLLPTDSLARDAGSTFR